MTLAWMQLSAKIAPLFDIEFRGFRSHTSIPTWKSWMIGATLTRCAPLSRQQREPGARLLQLQIGPVVVKLSVCPGQFEEAFHRTRGYR